MKRSREEFQGQKKKRKTYDFNDCENLIKNSNDFLLNSISDEINGTSIINSYSQKSKKIDDSCLSSVYLKKFEDFGHCLSINVNNIFKVPLFFDIDCIECKNGFRKEHVTRQETFIYIKCLCGKLETLLNLNPEKKLEFTLFKSSGSCGIHLYFHFDHSVSVPLYYYLISNLNVYLEKFNYPLVIDSVSAIPLPFSSKQDGNVYKVDIGDVDFFCGNKSTFLDVDYKICSKFKNSDFVVASFSNSYNNGDFWLQNLERQKYLGYLVIPSNFNLQVRTEINDVFKKLQFSEGLTSDFEAFENFLKKEKESVKNELESLPSFDAKNEIQKQFINFLVDLGKKVASVVGLNDIESRNFYYLFYLMSEPDNTFGYSFHVIGNILSCYSKLQPFSVDESTYFELIEVLHAISKNIFAGSLILDRTFTVLKKYYTIPILLETYTNTSFVFQFICKQLKIKKSKETDELRSIITIEDYNVFEEEIMSFLETKFFICKISDKLHIYDDGVYTECLGKDDVLSGHLNDLKISILKAVEFREKEKRTHLFPRINNRFRNSAKSITQYPNAYSYFVNTEHGVFNSLTGLYMPSVPFLFFTRKRKFGILSSEFVEGMTLNSLNNSILSESSSWERIADLISDGSVEKTLKIGLFVSGLLKLPEMSLKHDFKRFIYNKALYFLKFDDKTRREMFNCIYKVFRFRIRNLELIYNAVRETPSVFQVDGNFQVFMRTFIDNFDEKHLKFKFGVASEDELNFDGDLSLQFCKDDSTFLLLSLVVCILLQNSGEECDGDVADFFGLSDDYFAVDVDLEKHGIFNRNCLILPLARMLGLDPSSNILITIISVFIMFEYNTQEVVEFLTTISSLFQPKNENKKFVVLFGNKHGGKTFICSLLEQMCQGSLFKRPSAIPITKTTGADPNTIPIYQNYLTVISEVKTLNASIMKCLTGNEMSSLRNVFGKDHTSMYPVGTVIGMTNSIFEIEVDEAIEDRLSVFKVSNSFFEPKNGSIDNSLFSWFQKSLNRRQESVEKMSINLSNLIYYMFCKFRNKNAMIFTCINNKISKRVLELILKKNSIYYSFLFESGLIRDKTGRITVDVLNKLYDEYIEKFKIEKRVKFWAFLNTFCSFFDLTKEDDLIVGLRLETIETNAVFKTLKSKIKLIESPGLKLEFNKLKNYFRKVKISAENSEKLFNHFKNKYKEKIQGCCFIGLELKN